MIYYGNNGKYNMFPWENARWSERERKETVIEMRERERERKRASMRLSSADVEKREIFFAWVKSITIENHSVRIRELSSLRRDSRGPESAILVDRRENRAKRTERSDKSVSLDALNEKTDDIIWSTSKMRARFRLNRHLDEFFRVPLVESVNHYCRINHYLLKHCD